MPATKKAPERKQQSEPKPKSEPKKAAPKKGDIPQPFDDLHTAEDTQAVPGHFVEVTGGEYEGLYGTLIEPADKDNVIVRTRDEDSKRIVVAYTDLKPAESGRR